MQPARPSSVADADMGKVDLIEKGTTAQLKSVFTAGTRELSSALPF